MNIYLISQSENGGYDTFDAAVVIAESEEAARNIHPSSWNTDWSDKWDRSWASKPELVAVKLIGTAINKDAGLILASFNAG